MENTLFFFGLNRAHSIRIEFSIYLSSINSKCKMLSFFFYESAVFLVWCEFDGDFNSMCV